MPRPPIPPRVRIEDPWTMISSGLTDVINRRQSNLSLAKLHTGVGQIIATNQNLLVTGLEGILKDHFAKWFEELRQAAGVGLVSSFASMAQQFANYCTIIPKVYMGYDQTRPGFTRLRIRELFRDQFLGDQKLMEMARSECLKLILQARQGAGGADLSLVKHLMDLWFGFRDEAPKKDVLQAVMGQLKEGTVDFYDRFFREQFEGSFSRYLVRASEQFSQESRMLGDLMLPHGKKEAEEILAVLHERLLVSRESEFLGGEEPGIAEAMMEEVRASAGAQTPFRWLREMYQRFKTPLMAVYGACAQYCKGQVLARKPGFENPKLKQAELAKEVDELIKKVQELGEAYRACFADDHAAMAAFDEKIEQAWNDKDFKIAYSFNVFIHERIDSEYRGLDDKAKESFPQLVAQFFRRTQDKLQFKQEYRRFLTRRFIHFGAQLRDLEGAVIDQIAQQHEAEFPNDFRAATDQMAQSAAEEEEFARQLPRLLPPDKQTTVKFCPKIFDGLKFHLDAMEVNRMAASMSLLDATFRSFYGNHHANVRLSLLTDVSQVEAKLVVRPAGGQQRGYRVVSCITVATILMTVGASKGGCTVQQLCEAVDDQGLGLVGAGLCVSRHILVRKDPKPGEGGGFAKLEMSDVLIPNANFVGSSTRILLPPVQREVIKTASDDSLPKKQAIQAAVVRVLKQQKRMKQRDVEDQVIQRLLQAFRPDVALIRTVFREMEGEWFHREGTGDEDQVYLVYEE